MRLTVAAFYDDNCNTNFVGVRRRGQNNVYNRLKQELAINIVGIRYGAHTVYNALQNAVDGLTVKTEALVKIYKYFHIYTFRVIQLKEFCENTDVEYKNLQSMKVQDFFL